MTGSIGLASLAEVLAPDARFPTDREALLREHGWKVFDAARDRREHAQAWLSNLQPGEYATLDAILEGVRDARVASQGSRGTGDQFRSPETHPSPRADPLVPL